MMKTIETKEHGPCGNFTMMYGCMCDYFNLQYMEEVPWVGIIIIRYSQRNQLKVSQKVTLPSFKAKLMSFESHSCFLLTVIDKAIVIVKMHKNQFIIQMWSQSYVTFYIYTPAPRRRGGGVYCFTSVRPSFHPSKIFFVAFFSVTVDGRNLIFGHKRHIGIPYCGQRFWTRQIPTSCFLTLLIFIHIEHTFCICPFLVAFFSATTKTGRHDIAEILLKVALNTKNQIKYMLVFYLAFYCRILITFIHHKNAKY